MIDIPPGQWYHLKNLPDDVTEKEIAKHFCDIGFSLGPECVSIRRDNKYGTTAIISITRKEMWQLVKWHSDQKKFRGEFLHIDQFGTSKCGKRDGRF